MGFKSVKTRVLLIGSVAIAVFTVSACGGSNSSITVVGSTSGVPSLWGVITTDSTAITTIKTAESSTQNVTVQDGDQHQGNHVCGYSVSKNGHSYQVDYFTSNSLAASLIEAQCQSSAQQQFLSEAP
jgi:hypothetical protein